MSGISKAVLASAIGVMLAGCGQKADRAETPSVPNVVTADIQAGIESYIDEQVRIGEGHFVLAYGENELRLKLVRVHTEYLANLGPHRHFACVDLVDTRGDVYDVDFFLSGDPGAMNVTETTVHKLNGQPFYAWEQIEDGSWQRIAVEAASPRDLGIITGEDTFEFRYWAKLPQMTTAARMWLPLADTDSFQTVEVKSIRAPGKQSVLREEKHANKVLFLELDPEDSGKTVEIRYQVKRVEKAAYAEQGADPSEYLNPERLVPADQSFKTIADKVLKGKRGEMVRARALYDHTIDRMKYIKHGEGWGKGDAMYACDVRTGNCTDFHAYFIAIARAAGIPARFAIGAAIPSGRNDGGVDGYHCWAEFHADGKWWPVDISEGDKYSSLATYYFGHHPANRFEFSRGRDLVVTPAPDSGPINFLAYPLLEVGGEPVRAKVNFSFERSVPAS